MAWTKTGTHKCCQTQKETATFIRTVQSSCFIIELTAVDFPFWFFLYIIQAIKKNFFVCVNTEKTVMWLAVKAPENCIISSAQDCLMKTGNMKLLLFIYFCSVLFTCLIINMLGLCDNEAA